MATTGGSAGLIQPVVVKGILRWLLGYFRNPWAGFRLPTLWTMLKFALTENRKIRVPQTKQTLDETLPIVRPDFELLNTPVESGIRVTWIGHATVLVQMEKISILTDPVFSQQCGPIWPIGYWRYRDAPCTVEELPHIDAVIISHNHYDHLDYHSVKDLNTRFGEQLKWFVPQGLKSWMLSMGCENVVEQGWWQEEVLPATDSHPDVKFVFTPAQHWTGRHPLDRNKSLWGSWSILGPCHRFFFAGDSGYFKEMFQQIGNKCGPFDLAAIPIGAYAPRHIMRCQHVDPAEAVQIHCDIKAKKSIGVHWATFDLTTEPYMEPPLKVEEAMRDNSLQAKDFFTLKHGQTRHIEDEYECVD